jgi:cytochrome c-type biogenesis protein CcmE
MLRANNFVRNLAATAAFTLLLGTPALAQYRHDNNGYANRSVDGTVSSVVHGRNGDHVRLTNGMDLFVPDNVIPMNGGQNYAVSQLRAGDIIRADVFSRAGDGRDAQVRSVEVMRTRYGRNYNNNGYGREWTGTVVSIDRRNALLVVQTDNGRTMTVNANGRNLRGFRRGDRVSVTGRMNNGSFMADEIRGY